MKHSIIDSLLAILMMSVIVAIVKYGGYVISLVFKRFRTGILNKKYPVLSESFPFSILRTGDVIVIKPDIEATYQAKRNGKYYLESTHGAPFEGEAYLYADRSYLERNGILIRNDRVIKWKKEDLIMKSNDPE